MGWIPDNNGPPMPVFEGNPVIDDNPDDHLDLYNEYWSARAITNKEKRAKRFSSSLRLEAALWYNGLANAVKNDWPVSTKAFCERFRPADFRERVMGLLYRSRQLPRESIVTFANRVKKYQELLGMNSAEEKTSVKRLFVEGMRREFFDLQMMGEISMASCLKIARAKNAVRRGDDEEFSEKEVRSVLRGGSMATAHVPPAQHKPDQPLLYMHGLHLQSQPPPATWPTHFSMPPLGWREQAGPSSRPVPALTMGVAHTAPTEGTEWNGGWTGSSHEWSQDAEAVNFIRTDNPGYGGGYNCGYVGRYERRSCGICEQDDHNTWVCPQITCPKCNQAGHTASMCHLVQHLMAGLKAKEAEPNLQRST